MADSKNENPLNQFQPYLTWGAMGALVFAILMVVVTAIASLFGVSISRFIF